MLNHYHLKQLTQQGTNTVRGHIALDVVQV